MRNVLITGGTGKIGHQLVGSFIRDDYQVITTTRNLNNLDKLKDKLKLSREDFNKIKGIEVNFNHDNAVATVVNFFKSNPDLAPHILINNARSLDNLAVNKDGFSEAKLLSKEYHINVIIPYLLSVQLVSEFSNLENIINISSIYGIVPFNPNLYENYEQSAPIQYSLSKAAVIHLTKELAIRFREQDIMVNTVSYGGVEGRVDEDFKQRYAKLCPSRKMLTEEQTIGPVRFLASASAKGITGQNLIQDGGWTIW